MTEIEEDSPFTFPCDFPIKAMGLATDDFEALVVSIVRQHCQDLGENAVKTRPSKTGKYLAVTVTIVAQSKAQLDAIYLALNNHERVSMTL